MATLAILKVVESLQSAGLKLAVTTDRRLKVTPAGILTAELRDLIRASKEGLIDWLSNAANDQVIGPDILLSPQPKPRDRMTIRMAAASHPAEVDLKPPEPPADTADWRGLATAYYDHHFKCSTCIAAGHSCLRDSRCEIGKPLWPTYVNTHLSNSMSDSTTTLEE